MWINRWRGRGREWCHHGPVVRSTNRRNDSRVAHLAAAPKGQQPAETEQAEAGRFGDESERLDLGLRQ